MDVFEDGMKNINMRVIEINFLLEKLFIEVMGVFI